jgi:hypothetical protein
VTDFFGSVRNIELSNLTNINIKESEVKGKSQDDRLPLEKPLRSMDKFVFKPEVWGFIIFHIYLQ